MASWLLFVLLLTSVRLSFAMCPFKREAMAGGGPNADPEKMAEILSRINKEYPDHPPHQQDHQEEKRQTGFNPISQRISVSGQHAWQAPGPNDIRGPCPGLNALANHGYYPRSGVVGLLQGATAVDEVYGLALNFGLPLSLYATLVTGDPLTQRWSIGGPPPPILGLPILGIGNGLSGSHNKYEGDASPARGDYYLHDGDVETLRIDIFKSLYDIAKDDPVPNYNLDVMAYTLNLSKSTNPYFYWPPFAGVAVSNAAHTFIPALMSNHSDDYPDGILDKETLKAFFAITENPDGSLTYTPGHERIPENWYRRPRGALNDYSPLSFAQDLLQMSTSVPSVVSVGGNTGTVNSFTGVDLGDITGGVYNSADLLNPQKFTCYFYQLILATVPDILRSRFLGGILGTALNLLSSQLAPFIDPECAKISNFNDEFAAQFPGAALGGN